MTAVRQWWRTWGRNHMVTSYKRPSLLLLPARPQCVIWLLNHQAKRKCICSHSRNLRTSSASIHDSRTLTVTTNDFKTGSWYRYDGQLLNYLTITIPLWNISAYKATIKTHWSFGRITHAHQKKKLTVEELRGISKLGSNFGRGKRNLTAMWSTRAST